MKFRDKAISKRNKAMETYTLSLQTMQKIALGFFNKKLFYGMTRFSFCFLFVRFVLLVYMK